MKLSQLKERKWNFNLLAFAFPFVGMLIVMLVNQCCPFGKNSYLYSDMYHQYFPFFKTFRTALLSGDSLLYNWNIGLGIDFLGLYSYYLASPLNFLSVLIPESWLLGYFSLLVPIKLGLAGLFFGIFLQKIFDKQDFSIPLFASFYALCAWALGYQWNVMWLDTFALLPLVMLGMVYLLRDKKFVLYTITLFLSVAINYYIGLFTCIFVFLGFVCYEICRFKNIGTLCKDLGRIAIFSVIAIGMTAILSLPTLAALQNTQSSVNTFPEDFRLNMSTEHTWLGLLKTMALVAGNMNGGITYTMKEGLPNLYCGVLTTILAFLYLLCKQICLRDKICTVVLLVFFNVSFIIRQLDYIWHGFHFTNMIPYRFSYLYSFVLLYMAYSAWVHRKDFKLWQILSAAIPAVGIMFCYEDLTDVTFWIYNIVFILIYTTLLILYCTGHTVSEDGEDTAQFEFNRATHRRLCSILLLITMAAEIVMDLVTFGFIFPVTNTANYPKGKESTATVLAHMEQREKDNLFFRADTTHSQTLNDGALNGYYGVSAFTSSANVKVTQFMRALGYGAQNTYNRYCFEESTPVGNLFLGLKYMIERNGKVQKNSYFDDVFSVGSVHLLENNAYLPLGFLANAQLVNVKFASEGYRFSFQNTLMRNATGVQKDVWHTMLGRTLTITGDCPTLTPQPNTGYCDYITENNAGTITYSYTADREGFMCINLNLSQRNSFKVRLNNEELYSETYSLTQMLSVGDVTPGDVVEIELKCKANEKGTIKISAAIMDEELFRQGYETLAASVMEVTEFSNTQITGKINCNRDGVLYTSIPQDGNWSAYVDGQPAEIVLIGDAMIGLLLSEGEHTVHFEYRNNAFALGWKVSMAFLLVFVVVWLAVYKPTIRRYHGKYER